MASLQPTQRNTVLTLSSSNLFALERVESELLDKREVSVISRQPAFHDHEPSKESLQKYVDELEISQTELLKQYIITDFWNNLTIVTLPACFTNFVWRFMNLYGVAVTHNFWSIIGQTTLEIATTVFLICFIVDMIRQCRLYKKEYKYDYMSEIWNAYYSNYGLLSSIHLAFKFYMACIFWTIGYILVAEDHQIYTDKSNIKLLIYRALASGCGSFVGLVIASEIIAVTQYYSGLLIKMNKLSKNFTQRKGFWLDTNQKGILGVGFKGLCEGIAWSVMGDLDLYLVMESGGVGAYGACILDALTVGIVASLWFTGGGFVTSLLGYCEQRTLNNKKRKSKDEDLKFNDGMDDEDLLEDESVVSEEYEPLI